MHVLPRALPIAALLVPAAVLIAAGQADARLAAHAPTAALTRCVDLPSVPSASCGSVEVPLDRANPAAGTTSVAFALVPRRDEAAPSAGTLLFNPGGPGDPPIAHAADIAEQLAPLLETRDLL